MCISERYSLEVVANEVILDVVIFIPDVFMYCYLDRRYPHVRAIYDGAGL